MSTPHKNIHSNLLLTVLHSTNILNTILNLAQTRPMILKTFKKDSNEANSDDKANSMLTNMLNDQISERVLLMKTIFAGIPAGYRSTV